MRRKIIKKSLIILILCLLTLTYLFNYNVQARNIEYLKNSEVPTTESEKIIRYDVETNTSTIVDMEALEVMLANQNNGKIKTFTGDDIYKTMTIEKPLSTDDYSATKLDNSMIRQSPYRYVCRLTFKDSEDVDYYASASLCGPKSALTAAHCIFDINDNDAIYKDWKVFPGYCVVDDTYETCGAICGISQVYYSQKWLETHDSDYDWAICVLDREAAAGGYLICQNIGTSNEMLGMKIQMAGYPAYSEWGFDPYGLYQYIVNGDIFEATDYRIYFKGVTTGGFSGSPIMRTDNSYVIASLSGYLIGDLTTCVGVRITQEMINVMNSLIST